MTDVELGIKDYPYSVKIEQTALGARVAVHAYEHDLIQACDAAITLYEYARNHLERKGFKLAPEEPAPPKKVNTTNKET